MTALRFMLGYAAVGLLTALAAAILYFFASSAGMMDSPRAETASAEAASPVIVLDPGHGGEDGGCSGDGTVESALNLDVAVTAADILRLLGVPVRLTRTEDILLYDAYGDLADYRGQKKVYDLRNRMRIARETRDPVLVSIHMNAFTDSRYGGLQVWYSGENEHSAELAEAVQTYSRTYVDGSNTRATKRGKSMYLLDRAEMPAVIVECGFLSNPSDNAMLGSADGRRLVSAALAAAVQLFLDGYKNNA